MNKALLALIIILAVAWCGIAEEKLSPEKKDSGKIIMEETVKVYFENRQEIKRIAINDKTNDEREKIEKEIDDKIFKKLGVKSLQEAKDKDLIRKFYEERSNYIRGETSENPKVKFVDENGRTIKEIIGGEKSEKIELLKKGEQIQKIMKSISKGMQVSLNGEYMGYMAFEYDFGNKRDSAQLLTIRQEERGTTTLRLEYSCN